jgi:predicted RNA-binding protein YlxR (DUF448 family)
MIRGKRYPERTCVACRTTRQKRELVRIVRSPDGRMDIDETGRAPGRGAYLCADGGCWERALGGNALGRSLEAPVPDELRARLESGAADRRTGSPGASIATTTMKEN